PALVISDVHMPKMSGRELIAQLRAKLPTSVIPVILHTASSSEAEVLDADEGGGAFAVLVKPTEPEKLLAVVNRALGLNPSAAGAKELPAKRGTGSQDLESTDADDGNLQDSFRAAIDGSKLAALVEIILNMAAEHE